MEDSSLRTKIVSVPEANTPRTQDSTPSAPRNFLDYKVASGEVKKLVQLCDNILKDVKANRELRYIDIDQETERKDGNLEADEIYTPIRLINSNVQREQAKYIAYVLGNRSGIFQCIDNPSIDTQLLEADFTNKCRYESWLEDITRVVDSMQQNGYGISEIVFDTNYPGHFREEHVPIEDFGFYDDTTDIQSQEIIIRRIPYTRSQLQELSGVRFDPTQVKKIIDVLGDGASTTESVTTVEKVLFRSSGIVYVGWTCDKYCDDWLGAPKPLYLGVDDPNTGEKVPETQYNYTVYRYTVSENPRITDSKGRCFLDGPTQEASSSLLSSFITAHRRASNMYFSKDVDSGDTSDKQTSIKFVPGSLIDSKIKQFQLQAPGSDMISAIQVLVTQNQQENSQVNYAAMNRQDSRKTATEVSAATQESAVLSTIQVALFSSSRGATLNRFWRIYRSRVLNGKIITQLHPGLYAMRYVVKPAGDVDVIERQKKIQMMMQTWPVIQSTPIAQKFLQRLLIMMFPEDAQVYNEMFQQEIDSKRVLGMVTPLLKALAFDPLTGQIVPEAAEFSDQINAILQMADQKIQNNEQPQNQNMAGAV